MSGNGRERRNRRYENEDGKEGDIDVSGDTDTAHAASERSEDESKRAEMLRYVALNVIIAQQRTHTSTVFAVCFRL
jgi:hypothetical protein